MPEKNENFANSSLLHRRRIVLADGRYMIFYTFDESISTKKAKQKDESKTKDTEEKHV